MPTSFLRLLRGRIAVIFIVLPLTWIFLSQPLLGAEPGFENTSKTFIKIINSNDRNKIADVIVYPLRREVPLPSLETKSQFLQHFDEVFDEQLLKAIASSNIASDWANMGWRGIMFRDGILWLDDNGKITSINYLTEQAKSERARLIDSERKKLHSSLRQFIEPVLEWKTKDYRVRIDRINESKFRYAAWSALKITTEKPDIILENGTLFFDGSGGNHYYDFRTGVYLYRCLVNEIGTEDTPPGELEVYKNNKVILRQPATEVIPASE